MSEDLVLAPENSKDPLLNLSVEPKPDRFSGSNPSLKQNPLFRLLNPHPDNIRYLKPCKLCAACLFTKKMSFCYKL